MSAARVLLVGGEGRMGRFVREWLPKHAADLALAAHVGRGDDLAGAIERVRPDVGLDLTVAGLGAAHGARFLQRGVPVVIGTSGVTPEEDAELDALARESGTSGLVVPNFSLGIWLQQQMALLVARHLPSVEIVEEHHAKKKDAPSGTAADTARQLRAVRGPDSGPIPIHSVRLQGLYSNQEILFGGPGEVLTIRHQNFGLDAFGPGIVASLKYVLRAEPGVRRGLGVALEP